MHVLPALLLCSVGALVPAAAIAEDVVRDPHFHGGHFLVDAFGSGTVQFDRGQRLLELPGGDRVVAAVVPHPDTGKYTVGLARYAADGSPREWLVPSHPFGAGKSYVIHTSTGGDHYEVKYIRDFKLWKNVLYLLISADIKPRLPRGAPEPFEKADQVYVLAFEASGKFLKENPIRGVPAAPHAPALFAAGGIALYIPDLTALSPALHLAYSGTAYAGEARAEYARYDVDSNGTLTEIVAPTAIDPAGLCASPTDCEFRAIGLGGRPSPDQPPRVYLGGWHKPAGGTADFLAVQVDADGIPAPGFGSSGAAIVDFPASPLPEEFGRLLTVVAGGGKEGPETIYLAGEINGTCARGAGIVKLSANGALDPLFGDGGRVRWFSPDAPLPDGPECLGSGNLIRLRGGVVLDGDRLVFAGLRERSVTSPATGVESDALLTSIDRRSGEVKANGLVSYEVGVRTHDSGFTDLICAKQGAYIATGSIRVPRWSIPAWTSQVATVALKVN